MSNPDYDYYFKALAGEKLSISHNKPECGYWKRRFGKDAPWVAAAIWRCPQTGDLLCRVGLTAADPYKQWVGLARHPVAEADARFYFEHGYWPGQEPPQAAAEAAPEAAPGLEVAFYKEAENTGELIEFLADPAVAVAKAQAQAQAFTADGAALPNEVQDPYGKLMAEIGEALDGAAAWLKSDAKIETEQQATIIGNKIGTLRELSGKAGKMHTVEKKPHLEAGRAVDKRYNPFIKKLDETVAVLRRLATIWLQKAEDEAKAKAAAAAAQATDEADEEGPPFEPAQPVKIGGHTGKAIGLREHAVVQIGDMAKAAKAILADDECKAELEDLITKLARRMLNAGKKVATAKIVTEKIAA
jgi:hypothetical protein